MRVACELLEGWPDRPLIRTSQPARPKVKFGPRRLSPREKYGLRKVTEEEGPIKRLVKQPAPVIVRPPPPDPQEWYRRLAEQGSLSSSPSDATAAAGVSDSAQISGNRGTIDRSSSSSGSGRRRLFADAPQLTPGMRSRICGRIVTFSRWTPRLERSWLPQYLLLFDDVCAAVLFHHLPKLQPRRQEADAEQQQPGAALVSARTAERLASGASATTSTGSATGGQAAGKFPGSRTQQQPNKAARASASASAAAAARPRGAAIVQQALRATDRQAFDAMVLGVCGSMVAKLHGFSPEALAAVAAGCGRMGVAHDGLLAAWDAAAAAKLASFSSHQLATAMMGLAELQHAPSPSLVDAVLAVVEQRLQQQQQQGDSTGDGMMTTVVTSIITPSQLCAVVYAIGRLSPGMPRLPPAAWLERCAAAVQASPCTTPTLTGIGALEEASSSGQQGGVQTSGNLMLPPRDVARLVYGLGRLGYAPSADWVQWMAAQSVPALVRRPGAPAGSVLKAPELALLVQGAAALLKQQQQQQQQQEGSPEAPAAWLQAVVDAAIRRYRQFSWQDWTSVVTCLAELDAEGAQSNAQLRACVLDHSRWTMARGGGGGGGGSPAAHLLVTLRLLAAWRLEPADPWLSAFALASQARLGQLTLTQLADMAAALTALRVDMPLLWVSALLDRLAADKHHHPSRRSRQYALSSRSPSLIKAELPGGDGSCGNISGGDGGGDDGDDSFSHLAAVLGAVPQLCPMTMTSLATNNAAALRVIAAVCGRRLATATAPQLEALGRFFQAVGYAPGATWLQQYDDACERLAQRGGGGVTTQSEQTSSTLNNCRLLASQILAFIKS